MDKLSYRFEGFEGPLDLLLHLISKNKIDIYDIEIHTLLDQYMQQINTMQENNMDIASEFLEMAARLVHIKSAMLIPKHKEEAQELKDELTGQLVEYRECRRVAAMLAEMISFDRFCREPVKMNFNMTYTRTHAPEELIYAYIAAAGRGKKKLPPPADAFAGIVARPVVSVNSGIVYVLNRLWSRERVTYRSLFNADDGDRSKSKLVATFLAILELVKDKRIRVDGDGPDALIVLVDNGEKNG